MASIATHPQRNTIRLQLKQNLMLREMPAFAFEELERELEIAEYKKGEPLVRQGATGMGKEMILRFAAETDMEYSYAAWRLKTPIPYSIVAVTRARVAKLSMPHWVEFLDRHEDVKLRFEYEVMRTMSEVMAHTITLHLLDAPGRLSRFMRKHQELLGRIPKKELASYLNLTPETLSRLKQRVRM